LKTDVKEKIFEKVLEDENFKFEVALAPILKAPITKNTSNVHPV